MRYWVRPGTALARAGLVHLRRRPHAGGLRSLRRGRELLRAGHVVGVLAGGSCHDWATAAAQPESVSLACTRRCPLVPVGLDSCGWSRASRRACCVALDEPLRLEGIPSTGPRLQGGGRGAHRRAGAAVVPGRGGRGGRPPGDAPGGHAAVAVTVHGGCDNVDPARALLRSWAAEIASRGVVVFLPSHSLVCPVTPEDVHAGFTGNSGRLACAVRFARAEAERYGGNPRERHPVRHSSGANLAALAVRRPRGTGGMRRPPGLCRPRQPSSCSTATGWPRPGGRPRKSIFGKIPS
jgi:acetyl esterase/lipase